MRNIDKAVFAALVGETVGSDGLSDMHAKHEPADFMRHAV
tara:strand:- start:580 stop:699 length:120 start_codon:yes stop_codon:yes gene_type:complete